MLLSPWLLAEWCSEGNREKRNCKWLSSSPLPKATAVFLPVVDTSLHEQLPVSLKPGERPGIPAPLLTLARCPALSGPKCILNSFKYLSTSLFRTWARPGDMEGVKSSPVWRLSAGRGKLTGGSIRHKAKAWPCSCLGPHLGNSALDAISKRENEGTEPAWTVNEAVMQSWETRGSW